ncbi:uncharacterized protein LOC115888642 isoform X2 [Sitophilus oryzae]|nr:uncharacterized protein LOC115888642 isoform X2 [Sitophilus oryzae]
MKELMFKTFDEFNLWMAYIEKETQSKFIKYRGTIVKKSGSKISYYCHRSGFFNSESKGIRHLKTKGSNKINGFCPARIEVLSEKNGQCKIMFTQTHVGHTNCDLGHLSLSKLENDRDENNLCIEIDSKQAETKDLVQLVIIDIPGATRNQSVEEDVRKMRDHINEVLDKVTTKEQVEALKKLIAPMEPTLLAVMQKPSKSLLGTVVSENQQKFLQIKKSQHKDGCTPQEIQKETSQSKSPKKTNI